MIYSDQPRKHRRASRSQLGLTPILIKKKEQREAEDYAYEEELYDREVLTVITPEEINEIDLLFGGKGYHKKIYGYQTAVDSAKLFGCQFAQRTYHQAIAGPLAAVYAEEGIRLAREVHRTNGFPLQIVEFYTGSGALTYAFLSKGVQVQHTVDLNHTILNWAKENLRNIGCDVDSTDWQNQDALEFIDTIENEGWKLDLTVADPPWEGEYHSNDVFSVMNPHGARIVKRLLSISNVIGLKAPGITPDQAAFSLADEFKGKVSSFVCYYVDGPKKYTEKFFFFISAEAARKAGITRHQITEREVILKKGDT